MAPAPKPIVITGFEMPFLSMVGLCVKFSLAMIPATILVGLVLVMIQTLFGAFLFGLLGLSSVGAS